MVQKGKAWNHNSSTNRKFVLPKGTRFDPNFLPMIQNLTALGLTEGDIGTIVGYQGRETDVWLNSLKQYYPEVKEAAEIGKQIANSFLVAQMYKSAIGYDYEEIEECFNVDPESGELVKSGEKRKLKHQPGNAQLAMFISTNRMPEQFKHRIDIAKKGFIIDATQEISSDQIERLAGKLMEEARNVKQIESTVIETTFEPTETENVDSE